MAHLTEEQNEALRRAMQRAVDTGFRTRLALAEAMGVRPPVVSEFLNHKTGASIATAEAFAQKIARKPLEEVIGPRKLPAVRKLRPQPSPEDEQRYQIPEETRTRATLLLRELDKFSPAVIEIGFDSIAMRSAAEARNPAAVAEAVRQAVRGASSLPRPAESDAPPPGTRRSRKLAR